MIIIDIYKNKDIHDLDGEEWKDVVGYEGLYQISNLGRIKGLKRNKINNQVLGNKGYYKVHLCKNGKSKYITVHRLVAQAFISNPNNYPCVNHKNETRTNNTVDNLEWCTQKYNCNYGNHSIKDSLAKGKPVLLTNLDTGMKLVTLSAKDCAKLLDVSKNLISPIARSKNKTVKNHTVRYLPKDFEITTKEMNFTEEQKKHLLDSSVGEITL